MKSGRRHQRVANPWDLRPSEYRCLEALIEHGKPKPAAYALDITLKTFDTHMAVIKDKMQQRHVLHSVLEFAKWRDGQCNL